MATRASRGPLFFLLLSLLLPRIWAPQPQPPVGPLLQRIRRQMLGRRRRRVRPRLRDEPSVPGNDDVHKLRCCEERLDPLQSKGSFLLQLPPWGRGQPLLSRMQRHHSLQELDLPLPLLHLVLNSLSIDSIWYKFIDCEDKFSKISDMGMLQNLSFA